jgi:[ribosomal protein S5]-alanine N-acetyltransferase
MILHTDRLLLRPAEPSDVDALWALWTHPDVRRYLWDDEAISRERAAQAVFSLRQTSALGLGLWTMQLGLEAPLIGCAGLRGTETVGLIEPLVALHPTAWGRGLATEGLGVMLRYAFQQLKRHRLVATVDQPNARSHRLVQRLGFGPSGDTDGPHHRVVHYTLDRADADGRQSGPQGRGC